MKQPKRPVALMTVAQVVCAAAVFLTLAYSLAPVLSLSIDIYRGKFSLLEDGFMQLLNLLRDITLGACLIFVEVEAFRLCGRMKKASAFSPLNVAGLGRITIALGIAGLVSLLGNSIVPFLLTGLPEIAPVVQYLLLPFTLLTLALMARAVQVLMRRAVDMQEETDLTI